MPLGPIALEALALAVIQQAEQRIRHQAHMAPVHALDLVDLRRIDVQMRDEFGAAGKLGRIAGDAVVETRAERQQAIAVVDGIVGERRAVHAEHAHRQRVRRVDGADAHQRGDDRYLKFLGELAQGVRRAAVDHAAARIDQRALRRAQRRKQVGAGRFRQLCSLRRRFMRCR